MKKYLVIGNPIEHSLSPKLHNYWIKKNNIDGIYEKRKILENDIKEIIFQLKERKINGINVTVPFKRTIISFLDELTPIAKETQSVNTIYIQENKVIGHNTDAAGFELALGKINYKAKNKKIFILGAGGVVTSIISVLQKMGAEKIIISNRTKKKAEEIKKIYPSIKIVDWGDIVEFDMIINATSVGLKKNDEIKLNYKEIGSNKLFYDVIYNPKQTNFLAKARQFGNQIENGKMMFIYQAHQAFTIWHKIIIEIDDETTRLLD